MLVLLRIWLVKVVSWNSPSQFDDIEISNENPNKINSQKKINLIGGKLIGRIWFNFILELLGDIKIYLERKIIRSIPNRLENIEIGFM